jgi:predicted RNase H-like nuclease (RuvC/YqgF family)
MSIKDIFLNEIRRQEFNSPKQEITNLKQQLRAKDQKINQLINELDKIYRSKMWQIFSFYKKIFK